MVGVSGGHANLMLGAAGSPDDGGTVPYSRWIGHMVGSGEIRLLVQHEMAEIVSIIKCDADIMLPVPVPNRIGAALHVKVQYRY